VGLVLQAEAMKPCNPILREIDHRSELPWFLNRMGLLGPGVEVGVFKATYSAAILSVWKGQKLHLVDPWKKYSKAEYFDSTQDEDQEAVLNTARRNVLQFGQRANFIRMESIPAAAQFADLSLDWCFLDGNHKREAAAADIAAWWPKIRHGGLFSGHDFYTRLKDTDSDALNAVLDFAESIDTRPHATWCNSWYFIKP
jgi:hypothetical protein